jgi:hypothetical protein
MLDAISVMICGWVTHVIILIRSATIIAPNGLKIVHTRRTRAEEEEADAKPMNFIHGAQWSSVLREVRTHPSWGRTRRSCALCATMRHLSCAQHSPALFDA